MRLGEILVANGLLTASQLDVAIRSQLILGGHLGSSLIELGLIDEDTLGEVLSTMCGAPYARPELFANISKETIRVVPPRIAQEYLAIPLRLEDRSVHVALVNPRDIRVRDEISFAIGRQVLPWIAPEVRLYEALETFYGIARRARYIKLGERLNEVPDRHLVEDSDASSAEATAMGGSRPGDAALEDAYERSFGYGRSWQEIADELDGREPVHDAPSDEHGGARKTMPLTELAERYCRAESPEDLARAALEFSAGRAERLLLLIVRSQRASVWHDRGLAIAEETRVRASFEVTSEPLFRLLMGEDHYHGPLPPSDDVQSFFRGLDVEAPSELLLIPIRLNDLLVAVAVADGGTDGCVRGDVEELRKAFRLFGMSLVLLATRKMIRDAARPETTPGVVHGEGV